MANAFYNGTEITNEITEEDKGNDPIEAEELSSEVTNEYIGYLTIPKINLTKGFLDMRSEDNDVEKNILVVSGSNYPDTDRGNLILAGHSGTGWKAFFNDLYKLSINDTAYVTYKNKKYIYNIVNIYTQEKTGKLAIYRNYDKTTLTLITCTNNVSTTQTVYIAELVSIEE
jgi:LPXTG-site transpeptidase (sortase) family protein